MSLNFNLMATKKISTPNKISPQKKKLLAVKSLGSENYTRQGNVVVKHNGHDKANHSNRTATRTGRGAKKVSGRADISTAAVAEAVETGHLSELVMGRNGNEKVWAEIELDAWRIFKIMAEFVSGFEKMAALGPAVTIFGSARVVQGDKVYKLAERTAELLAAQGFGVITGGGPGIMEAGNRGAKHAGGASIGFNIELAFEQVSNPFVDRDKLITFNYFFVRKAMFMKYSQAFIVMPGGFGTLDEFSEAITLIQTKKVTMFPVILVGKKFWSGLIDWMRDVQLHSRYISENDFDFIHLVDTPEEAVQIIQRFYPENKYAPNF